MPDMQTLFDQLILKEKNHKEYRIHFVTRYIYIISHHLHSLCYTVFRKDVLELASACSQVESFCSQISDVLHLLLGGPEHRYLIVHASLPHTLTPFVL